VRRSGVCGLSFGAQGLGFGVRGWFRVVGFEERAWTMGMIARPLVPAWKDARGFRNGDRA
jgi:hypothetical protein